MCDGNGNYSGDYKIPEPFKHVDKTIEAAADFADQILFFKMIMMDKAIKCCLVHIPSDELSIGHDVDCGDDFIITRGQRVFRIGMDTVSLEVSISGEWLMWPLPAPRLSWADIDVNSLPPLFGD